MFTLYSQMAFIFYGTKLVGGSTKKVKEKTGRKHPITCKAQDLGLRCLSH